MIVFVDLALYPRILVIVLGLLLTVLLMSFALIALYRRHILIAVPLMVIVLCGGVLSWFLLCLHKALLFGASVPLTLVPWAKLPLWEICLCYLILLISGGALMIYHSGKFHHTVGVNSIKESADNLPTGMCFSYENGLPLLVNRKMEELCNILTKKGLWNTHGFWQALREGRVADDVLVLGTSETPVFRLSDGRTWTFTQQRLLSGGNVIYQLLAVDTTELHRLGDQLRQDNNDLAAMNKRLLSYSDDLTAVTRDEEILKAKITIHDYLGQVLLASKRHLLNKTNRDLSTSATLLAMWQKCVSLLRHEMMREKGADPLLQLKNAAKAVGVSLEMEGAFPAHDPRASRLIFLGAKEALTNAVCHGAATKLHIDCREEPGGYTVVFTNNGLLPGENVTEGGGLSGLRKRLETVGGSMAWRCEPGFVLTVKIPGKEQ